MPTGGKGLSIKVENIVLVNPNQSEFLPEKNLVRGFHQSQAKILPPGKFDFVAMKKRPLCSQKVITVFQKVTSVFSSFCRVQQQAQVFPF